MATYLVVLTMFLSSHSAPGSMCAEQKDQQSSSAQKQKSCWKGSQEIPNPDVRGRKAPPPPKRFDGAKVGRTAVVVKLCINADGQVAKSILLTSSENQEIDEYYRDLLSTWKFKPILRDGVPVPSVVTIAVNWNPA
jgi:TonB family protein